MREPIGIGTHVNVHDGDERKTASGYVVGVATYEARYAPGLVRGYVVELDAAYRGWIDAEEPGRNYVSLLTVHPDAVRVSEVIS